MPKFLEDKLKKEYGKDSSTPYKIMNSIGAMRGNKITAKGEKMEEKHVQGLGSHKKHHISQPKKKKKSFGGSSKLMVNSWSEVITPIAVAVATWILKVIISQLKITLNQIITDNVNRIAAELVIHIDKRFETHEKLAFDRIDELKQKNHSLGEKKYEYYTHINSTHRINSTLPRSR